MAKETIEIDFDVDSKKIGERITDAIEDGIEDGAGNIGEQSVEAGKTKLVQEGAVWKGDILASFRTDTSREGDTVILKVRNTSDHAAPINDGANPDSPPPVHNLAPWVDDNLQHWIPEDMDWVDNISTYLRNNSTVSLTRWSDLVLAKSYWLSKRLDENGIDAVPFMDFAESWIERHGEFAVRNKVMEELSKRGLS